MVDTGTLDGFREQSIVDCFPGFVFQFSVAQVLVELRKQFIHNFAFPNWSCAACFNNNNNNNIIYGVARQDTATGVNTVRVKWQDKPSVARVAVYSSCHAAVCRSSSSHSEVKEHAERAM